MPRKRRKTQPRKLSQVTPPKELPAAPRTGVIAASASWGEGSTQHPGWGLTAERIRASYMLAEGGWPQQQCDVFEDVIERDAHLRSQLEGRIEAVTGKAWIIQAGGPDVADVEAAQALERALRRVPNWNETIEHLLMAMFYGYSGAEIVWEYRDGLNVPTWFATVPHRRFRFLLETDEPRLMTKAEPVDGVALEAGKWLFVKRQHRKTVRSGLMRTAVWWSWLKSLGTRDLQIYCSRFGLPFVTGRHEPSASEETIAKLKSAVLAFGQNGGAVFSNEGELEVIEAKGGSGDGPHPAMIALANAEISKLFLGGTLTSGEGSSTGSYALGQVHANAKFDRTLGDADRVGTWTATQLGEAFVRFNGMAARPPRLKIRVTPEMNPVDRMKVASVFANELGGELDEDQIRDEFDLKRPSGGGLKGTKKPAEQPAADGAPTPADPAE